MPLTIKQWQANESLRLGLQIALDNPALKEAFETLVYAYLPTAPPSLTIEGETKDLTTVLALRHLHRAGFYGFLTALQNLTKSIEPQKEEMPGWGQLHPEPE